MIINYPFVSYFPKSKVKRRIVRVLPNDVPAQLIANKPALYTSFVMKLYIFDYDIIYI